jgi:hypothetical protein
MKELLVVCPTRERPKIFKRMLDSYYKTKSSTETEMIVYLHEDDELNLTEYEGTIKDKGDVTLRKLVGERLWLAQAYNRIFLLYPEYKYYSLLNDDHVFLTPGWDKKLIEIIETQGRGWGVACAEDLLTAWDKFQHPSGMVISGNIPRTLGYMVWPKIEHIGIDCYLMHLMNGIERMFHTEEVIIEHMHWSNGKALLDGNYKRAYQSSQYEYGMSMVSEYRQTQLDRDIAILKEAMRAGQERKGSGW